jgi:hypothetical protein
MREDIELEVFFDDDVITLEMHEVFIDGSGMINDPETGHLEVISFRAPISTGNIVLNPEETIGESGDLYPRFMV